MQEKLQDIIIGAKDKVYDVTSKDITSNALEYTKEKVYNGVGRSKDAILDNVQPRLEKTNKLMNDSFEKVKLIKEDVAFNMQEGGHGISERTKDVACKTIECLEAQAHKAKYILPNLGHGIEYIYNHRMTNDDEKIKSLKETTTNINEIVDQMEKNDKASIMNGVNSAIKSKQFYENMKDNSGNYYHKEKNLKSKKYNFVKDIIQDYHPKVGQRYRDIRNYYDRSNNYYRSKGGRQYHKDVQDILFRSYFDDTKGEAKEYFDGIKDKTRPIFKATKDRTKDFYNVRDSTSGDIPNQHEEGSRGYYPTLKQKVLNNFHNAHDVIEDYYTISKFKPGKDLDAIIESMDLRRIEEVPPNHVPSSSFEEVVNGNVKYTWHGKEQPTSQEYFAKYMSNTMKSATHNTNERVDLIKKHTKKGIKNMQDIGVRAKDQMHDTFQANKLPQRGRAWVDRRSTNHEDEDDINDKDDDYIVIKRTSNLMKKMQNRRNAYEFQHSNVGEYAKLTQQEFSKFMKYEEDKKIEEINHDLRSWKDDFFKRPQGFLLSLICTLHLFTFSMVYGSSFWMTFVSSIILSKHIPRQQFGYVQSKMFPIYLRILVVGQSILFILYFIMHPWFIANSVERCQLSNFGLMIASTLINAYVLEPQAIKIMFEQLKVEKEEERGLENVLLPMDAKQMMEEHKKKLMGINQQFKALHGYSSAFNLINLGGLTCHLWHLSHCLVI